MFSVDDLRQCLSLCILKHTLPVTESCVIITCLSLLTCYGLCIIYIVVLLCGLAKRPINSYNAA